MALIDDVLGDLGIPAVRVASGRRRQQQDFTPEQEQSLLSSLGHSALSGISTVGNLLDLPGSMLRDAVSGHNPFDQVLSPFSSENRQTGRDVLTTWGVTGPNDPNAWEAADFGGFAAELALDPLLPLSLGAKAATKGGAIAARAGLMKDLAKVAGAKVGPREARMTRTLGDLLAPRVGELPADVAKRTDDALRAAKAMGIDDLASVSDEPLGGLFGFGVPFKTPSYVGGSVQAAKKLDDLGRKIQFAKIPGTDFAPMSALNRLFNAKVGDASSQVGQRNVLPDAYAGRFAGRAKARGAVGDITMHLLNKGGPLANEDQGRALRRLYENIDVAATPELAEHYDKVREVLDPMTREAEEWGLHGSELIDSKAKYFPRYKSKELRDKFTGDARIVSTFDPQNVGREPMLKNLGQGTDTIFQMLEDPGIKGLLENGGSKADIAARIESQFGNDVPAQFVERTGGNADMSHIAIRDRREAIADWFQKLDPAERASGVFGNHPLQDLAARLTGGYETLEVGKRILTQLASPDTLKEAWRTTRTPGESVLLTDVLRNTGFVVGDENGGALKKFLSLTGSAVDENAIKAAHSLALPKDFADDIVRYMQSFKSPDVANELIKQVDNVTNIFKAGVTSPWPAFHIRNLFSGQWQNLQAGQFSARALGDANKIIRGETANVADIPVVQHELRRLGMQVNEQNATDLVRRMAYQHNVVGKYESLGTSGTTPSAVGSSLGDLIGEMPGSVLQGSGTPFDPKEALGLALGRNGATWNLKNAQVQGVGDALETTFAPVAAGQHLGHYIEGLNRLTPFVDLLRKGVAPAEAASRIAASQVEYGGRAFTPFERQVVGRIMPFYKFTKGMVPYTIRQLWEQPGGALAQTIRGQNRARGDDAATPDYVSETASIPLGQTADGSNRYVTGFGLPMEDALSFVGSGVRGGLMEAVSRSNPLIKAPLEWATGESFFQKGPQGGRDLEDLDPTIGRTLSNIGQLITGDTTPTKPVNLPDAFEFLAANSPLARGLTTARTVTDPRKHDLTGMLGVLSGIKVSDVSPAAQDAVVRERSAALMKSLGAKSFARTYFPKEDMANMSPDEQLKAMQLQALMKLLADKAKERKAEQQRGQ